MRLHSFGISTDGSESTVLALTSRTCGEGVTTVAFKLACELAKEGNTLLVDASPEGKRITDILKVEAVSLAIKDINRINPQTKRYITKLTDPNLDIITISDSDKEGNNPSDFNLPFWMELRSYYKSIIVDTGSLQKSPSRIWSNWVDHTLLVIDATSTTKEILERFSSDLSTWNLKISGFIINKRSFHIPNFLLSMVR